MEDQKKPNNIVVNIWRNWCSLEPQQRSQVADRLGPLGHALSIAANVSEFARQGAQPPGADGSAESRRRQDDEDVIDVEFEECDP